jgi:hypothetical protein
LTAAPARAQTYGGNAPICLHRWYWGGGETFYCGYSSMAQCHATASGLPAMCITNPYFANPQVPRELVQVQPVRSARIAAIYPSPVVPQCDATGELPSKRFMNWHKEQNAVSEYSATVSN